MTVLKELEKVIAGNISSEKDRLQREYEDLKKQMSLEKKAHDQQMTKEKQAFEEYKGECNTEIASKKRFLEKSINELASIENNMKKLKEEDAHVTERKEVVKAKEKEVSDALIAASQAKEKAEKAEDLFNKKLEDIT